MQHDANHCPQLLNLDIAGLQFVDDMCLISLTPIGLNRMLSKLEKYCDKWNLKINVNKTTVLICKKGIKQSKHENWIINKNVIEKINNIIYLGIKINNTGTWSSHIKHNYNIGKAALSRIDRIKTKLPDIKLTLLKKKLYFSLVESKIVYGCEAWFIDTFEINTIDQIRYAFCKKALSSLKTQLTLQRALKQESIAASVAYYADV